MTQTLSDVAKRISREVGTPKTVSYRIARKLNNLAASVDWGQAITNGDKRSKPTVGRASKRRAALPARRRRQAPRNGPRKRD